MKTGTETTRVLIAEDSPSARELLAEILGSDPGIKVVKAVINGEEAVDAVMRLKPDIVTMDLHMPKMDGIEATRKIMNTRPVPIVMISGTFEDQVAETFRAVEAGALAFLPHPPSFDHPDHAAAAAELVRTVKLMAEVQVVRRWTRSGKTGAAPEPSPRPVGRDLPSEIKLIAIGSSTGGPLVLQTILRALGKPLTVPVLVVQHIEPGFVHGLAQWLSDTCGLAVHVADQGQFALPGNVYVAPARRHMGVHRNGSIALSDGAVEHGVRPSVSFLFRSVAEAMGRKAVGVLLTGMGTDGAAELKLMRDAGAVTIAQDVDSSVIHGMPGEAIKLDAAGFVLAPDEIAETLNSLLQNQGAK